MCDIVYAEMGTPKEPLLFEYIAKGSRTFLFDRLRDEMDYLFQCGTCDLTLRDIGEGVVSEA
jgi:hypothetical protein